MANTADPSTSPSTDQLRKELADARTELDRTHAQLRRTQAELADARKHIRDVDRLAELGTLTGGLAHEIKNPLSTVQLNLQLLSEDIDPDWPAAARVVSRLKTVQRETGRLREILDDFLRYAGKLELDIQRVDLRSMVEDLADFFDPQAQAARVKIRVRPGEPVWVHADERLIKQTLLNLMLNAVQAMGNDERGGELILSSTADANWGVVHVIDTGPGISPETQSRIFDAYYTTKKGGTGLGLAMARRILKEHAGELTVTSEPGKGSDFTLKLPLA